MSSNAQPRVRKTALLLWAVALFGLLMANTPSFAAESLDEILGKYYEALGGKDAWSKIGTVKTEGSMSMMGMEFPYTVWTAEPDKMRLEFEMQGMKGIQAIDGESGWMVMPFMTGSNDPEPLPAEMIKSMSAGAGVSSPLFDYKEKGHAVELIGETEVEGTKAYHLKATLKNGYVIDYFLDAEYYVPIQQKMVVSAQGQEFESTTTLSDYKEVSGVLIPFTSTQTSPMGEQVITTKTVEANVDLADDLFEMPTAAEDG